MNSHFLSKQIKIDEGWFIDSMVFSACAGLKIDLPRLNRGRQAKLPQFVGSQDLCMGIWHAVES
jgi:hypothetical protein